MLTNRWLPASPERSRRVLGRPSSRARWPAAEAFESASRQSGSRLLCPESCVWLRPRKLLGSRAQALADRAAAILFYVAVASGAITFAYWWFSGDKVHALIRTATVLIIACPHALGLAIPLVIAISTSLGAQNGLLIKDRVALERARNLDVVIFDKTGTLTRGSPALSGVTVTPGHNDSDVLALAAAVEANSEHPLAKAIVAEARRRKLPTLQAADFEALPGRGAQARVDTNSVIVVDRVC